MALKQTTFQEMRQPEDPETGLYVPDGQPEVHELVDTVATGKDCQGLIGAMGDSPTVALQQAHNREKKFGVVDLPSPDGVPVRVLGNQVDQFLERGFGQKSMRPSFSVQGFGRMKRDALRKTITRYRDGKAETIYEERLDGTITVGG